MHKGAAAQQGDNYGSALSLDCGRLAVGFAKADSTAPVLNNSGVVEIHTLSSGIDFRFTVDNPLLVGDTEFGSAIALDGPYMLVGAPNFDPVTPGAASGAAFLFRDRTLVKFWYGDSPGDRFGQAVALERDRVAIGAPMRAGSVGGTAFSDLGTVYIYQRNQGGGDNWGRVTRLTAPIPSSLTYFGGTVALDGNDLAIGAPRENRGGTSDAGAAYLFSTGHPSYDHWTLDARLQPDGLVSSQLFGQSIGLSHGRVFIGGANAGAAEPSAAAAWLFSKTGDPAEPWRQEAVLTTSDPDSLGISVAIDGSHLIAGDPTADVFKGGVLEVDRGEIYDWVQVGKQWMPLRSASGNPGAGELGASLALVGDLLMAGAPGESVGGNTDAGAVYVFREGDLSSGGWGLVQRLTDPEGSPANARFGSALAADAQWLIAGSPGARRAAMFTRGTVLNPDKPWTSITSLTVSPAQTDGFGSSVAIADGRALVGAPQRSVGGAAYLFERNEDGADQWAQIDTLLAGDASVGDAFGTSVALQAGIAVVGAPLDDTAAGTDAGSVYVFSRTYGEIDGWALLQGFTPDALPAASQFGMAVALDRTTFAVGAPLAPAAGSQGAVEIYSFRALTHYDEWAASWGLYGAAAEPHADGDGNGQENIIEYFFGTDPGDPNSFGTLAHRIDGGNLIVTFPKACTCEGIGVLTAEISSDLVTWTAAGPVDILQDTASLLQIQVPVTVPGRRFVRFRAEVP